MKRKHPTVEQQKAAQAKRDRFKGFVRQVAAMTEDERLELASKIGIVTCEGHPLSRTNTILVHLQNPSATVVGGFRQWIRGGRCVKKGETSGIMIWVPSASGSSADDSDVRFLTANVFDISQTEELAEKAAA